MITVTDRHAAAGQRPRMARALRLVRDAQRELATVADGVRTDVVASLLLTGPADVDDAADLLRTEAARRPLAVFVTADPTTTAPTGAKEDHHDPNEAQGLRRR